MLLLRNFPRIKLSPSLAGGNHEDSGRRRSVRSVSQSRFAEIR